MDQGTPFLWMCGGGGSRSGSSGKTLTCGSGEDALDATGADREENVDDGSSICKAGWQRCTSRNSFDSNRPKSPGISDGLGQKVSDASNETEIPQWQAVKKIHTILEIQMDQGLPTGSAPPKFDMALTWAARPVVVECVQPGPIVEFVAPASAVADMQAEETTLAIPQWQTVQKITEIPEMRQVPQGFRFR